MKKALGIILIVATIVACCFAFTACNKGEDKVSMIDIDLSSEQYAFAFKKSDTELMAKVNKIMADNAAEIENIKIKYLNATGDELATFGSIIQNSATGSSDEFVVATNLEFSPFEYMNGAKMAGIDIEIAQLIAKKLNKKLVVENMDFDAVVTSVQNLDKYDIGMAGLTINEDRKKLVAFGTPYFDTTQVILVKEGNATFKDCKTKEEMLNKLKTLKGDAALCGGQKATTGQQFVLGNEALEFAGFKNLKFSGYSSPALAVKAMLDGKINFVIVDKAVAQTLVKNFNK